MGRLKKVKEKRQEQTVQESNPAEQTGEERPAAESPVNPEVQLTDFSKPQVPSAPTESTDPVVLPTKYRDEQGCPEGDAVALYDCPVNHVTKGLRSEQKVLCPVCRQVATMRGWYRGNDLIRD